MKIKIGIITFLMGILLFLFYQQWIIIHINFPIRLKLNDQIKQKDKQTVTLFFFKNNGWIKETTTIVGMKNSPEALQELIKKWLTIADEEELIEKKIILQHVAISYHKTTAYLSFEQSLFNKQDTIEKKLIIIESLIKTIKESNEKISYVYLLVSGKPLQDQHLNFSIALPTSLNT